MKHDSSTVKILTSIIFRSRLPSECTTVHLTDPSLFFPMALPLAIMRFTLVQKLSFQSCTQVVYYQIRLHLLVSSEQ